MAIGISGLRPVCLAGSAIGGLIALASPATAQWAPPWRAAWPGEVERYLEAQGYVLTAPLTRRPGVYLADVSIGPGSYQRLIIDAGSGRILESFPAASPMRRPLVVGSEEGFGEPSLNAGRPLYSPGAPTAIAPAARSAYGGAAPVGTRQKTKTAPIEHKIPGTKAATRTPPVPPPAPREAAKTDEPADSTPAKIHYSDQSRASGRPIAVDNSLLTEESGKTKVSIVPPALFE
jgi:hypothetical protein